MPKRSQPSVVLHRLQNILGHVVTRMLLSAAIIVSLLPIPGLRGHDLWFLMLFGPEFVIRSVLLFRAEWTEDESEALPGEVGWRWPKVSALLLMLLDLVALVSFVPIHPIGGQATRWLRLFRLARMLLLVRYWAPLARDLWAVLLRAERGRQVGLMGLVVLVLSFAGAVVLDHLAIEGVDFDGDDQIGDDPQDLKFLVRLWWAFRQIQDPGNMLSSPTEVVTLVLSLALTVFGLFLVSFLIGLGTDVVRELMELSRLRPPGLRGHTVVVNITPATRQVLFELMRHYRKLFPDGLRILSIAWTRELIRNAWRDRRYVTVGATETPPDFLREPELAKVIYRQASRDDDEHALLQRTDIQFARRIILLADLDADADDPGRDPDDETIRTVLTVVESMRGEGDPRRRHARTRLIAEILDESNIPAARRAMASLGETGVYAQVVATERLLALFIACVARRGHVTDLLLELMTSRGHEVYTYDFKYPTSTAKRGDEHAAASARTMRSMLWHGLRADADDRVLPIGLLYEERDAVQVIINPIEDEVARPQRCRGFVGLAPNFRVMADFAHYLEHAPAMVTAPPDSLKGGPFSLEVETPGSLRRVLICGFRPASVNLVESLVVAERGAEIMILVDDVRQVERVIDDFDSHTNLVRKRLLEGRHGLFVREGAHTLRYESIDGRRETARIQVAAGERSSSRQLAALPYDFGAVTDMDCLILLSDEHDGADARTTTTLMKLEALDEFDASSSAARGDANGGPRVVAELLDDDLAQRLSRRYRKLERFDVSVFSIQEMRAFFMFQSVVVPHFDLVYVELMGPWGQSFVPLELQHHRGELCSFSELARHVYARNALLVGVELRDPLGDDLRTRLYVAEGPASEGDTFDLGDVVRLWVIELDASQVGPRVSADVVRTPGADEALPG